MKRAPIIFLIAALLFNTLGSYVVFYIDISEAKHEAAVFILGHEAMGEKITLLTFPMEHGRAVAPGLFFTDDDEFMYQGRMYDIAGSEQYNDQITYKCFSDNKETAINQDLSDKIESDTGTPSQNRKSSFKLKDLIKDYLPQRQQEFCLLLTIICPHSGSIRTAEQSYIYTPITSPPPEQATC